MSDEPRSEALWTPTFYKDLIEVQTRIETKLDAVKDSLGELPKRVQILEQEVSTGKAAFRVIFAIFLAGIPALGATSCYVIKLVTPH